MIKSKTVFVIGAGASHEVNMPVGSKLAEQISMSLSSKSNNSTFHSCLHDDRIYDAICQFDSANRNKYIKAALKISKGVIGAHSIDDFIDSFPNEPEIATVGKLAIALTIKQAEAQCSLPAKHNEFALSRLANTWYIKLLQILTSGVPQERISEILNNVTFISFNYDRCLEHFLCNGLASRFGKSPNEIYNIVKQDKFLHPYGSLGDYRLPEHQDGLYFGNENYNDLNSIAKNIKTYSERSEPISEVTVAIRKELAEAETIIFLGFAFHLQNIELIRPPEGIKAKRIFATTKGRYV